MTTFGGRRAAQRASRATAATTAALTLALLATLTGCADALDQAHTVQTHLGRIDEVADATVSTPSTDTGAAITVTYSGIETPRELGRLIAEVDEVADEQSYPSYRLDLLPEGSTSDRLTVDDSFTGSADAPEVLASWFTTTAALLGDVRYRFEPGVESIDVNSGAGILHDVGEASRTGYGFAGTVWTFRTGDSAFVVEGRVSPSDVALFQTTQRTVTSEVLPAPAEAWQLQRRDQHVLLDLDVRLPDAPVAPERLTIAAYGTEVERLAAAAIGAARTAGLPITLRLLNPVSEATDVFGFWASDTPPTRGRDPLLRGWDVWLRDLAGG